MNVTFIPGDVHSNNGTGCIVFILQGKQHSTTGNLLQIKVNYEENAVSVIKLI